MRTGFRRDARQARPDRRRATAHRRAAHQPDRRAGRPIAPAGRCRSRNAGHCRSPVAPQDSATGGGTPHDCGDGRAASKLCSASLVAVEAAAPGRLLLCCARRTEPLPPDLRQRRLRRGAPHPGQPLPRSQRAPRARGVGTLEASDGAPPAVPSPQQPSALAVAVAVLIAFTQLRGPPCCRKSSSQRPRASCAPPRPRATPLGLIRRSRRPRRFARSLVTAPRGLRGRHRSAHLGRSAAWPRRRKPEMGW